MEADRTNPPACPGCAARDRRIGELEARLAALEALVERLRRGGKRQAAPFSKGPAQGRPEAH